MAVCLLAVGLAGCVIGGGSGSVLSGQFDRFLGDLAGNTVFFQIVNEDELGSEIELRLDGEIQTVDCDPGSIQCIRFLNVCPEQIETVHIRKLEPGGDVLEEFNYTGTGQFVFTRDNFACGDTLFFDLSSEIPNVFVIGR